MTVDSMEARRIQRLIKSVQTLSRLKKELEGHSDREACPILSRSQYIHLLDSAITSDGDLCDPMVADEERTMRILDCHP